MSNRLHVSFSIYQNSLGFSGDHKKRIDLSDTLIWCRLPCGPTVVLGCRKVYTIITETTLSLLQQLLDLALIRQIHIEADSLRDLWEIVVLHYKHSRVKISLVYKGASPPPCIITAWWWQRCFALSTCMHNCLSTLIKAARRSKSQAWLRGTPLSNKANDSISVSFCSLWFSSCHSF